MDAKKKKMESHKLTKGELLEDYDEAPPKSRRIGLTEFFFTALLIIIFSVYSINGAKL